MLRRIAKMFVAMIVAASLMVLTFLLTNKIVHVNQLFISSAATDLFNEQWALIREYFVREIPDTAEARKLCLDRALAGGISKCLNDPHSRYVTGEEAEFEKQRLIGKFVGIGVAIFLRNGEVTVAGIEAGSPAALSGAIHPGDVIVEIDGEKVAGKDLLQVMAKIRGAVGTEVRLTLLRNKKLLPPVTLTRGEFKVNSVETAEIDAHTTLIRVRIFDQEMPNDLYKVIAARLRDESGKLDFGKKSFVLDLRDNPGGLVVSAKIIASYFCNSLRDKFATFRSRSAVEITRMADFDDFEAFQTIVARKKVFRGLHFVILVNERSASATELFSGLMQQWGRAKLVGKNTYGKGVVQGVFPLSGGGALHLTTAEYFIGEHLTKVHGVGIAPDFVVENEVLPQAGLFAMPPLVDLAHDAQLRKALEVLYDSGK